MKFEIVHGLALVFGSSQTCVHDTEATDRSLDAITLDGVRQQR